MLEGVGSMIRLKKLTQLLISDPSKEPLVLIEKKPLPRKDEKRVNSSREKYNDCYNEED
jgi:hypothetical protein